MDPEYDPCDRCGSRSYVWVTSGDAQLSYCAHHGTKYMTGLLEFGSVLDLRYMVEA